MENLANDLYLKMSKWHNTQNFHEVIKLPDNYDVLDLTTGNHKSTALYTIGKYNELRKNLYTNKLFQQRNIHMGIDIGAPANTDVYCFFDGEVFLFNNNTTVGDYGPTLITKHFIKDSQIYVLHGHLSKSSIAKKQPGQKIKKGEVIGQIGSKNENGGWPPHIHIQLSIQKPLKTDMPGVVSAENLETSLSLYPDPRLILGPIY